MKVDSSLVHPSKKEKTYSSEEKITATDYFTKSNPPPRGDANPACQITIAMNLSVLVMVATRSPD